MVAKDSVKSRLSRADQGHFLHRVQLHAAAGLRLPPPVRRLRCRLQVGGSDQWGNITMGIELIRKVRQAGGLGTDHAAGGEGGRDQVRQDRVGHRLAGRRPDQSLPAVPVLPPHRGRRGRDLPALLHLPLPRGDRRRSTIDADPSRASAQAQRELARQVCTLVHGAAETDPGGAGGGRPVRRRDRPTSTSEALLDVFADAPSTEVSKGRLDGCRPDAGRPAGRDRAGPGPRARPAPPWNRAVPTSTTDGRPTSTGRSAPMTWWPVATWCCAGASASTTWCSFA